MKGHDNGDGDSGGHHADKHDASNDSFALSAVDDQWLR